MRILLIEDDNIKRTSVKAFLKATFKDAVVTTRLSYHSGLGELFESQYDLLVLDMSLPNYDISAEESGGPFSNFAGEEILDELDRNSIFVKTIILTQFDTFGQGDDYVTLEELESRLRTEYSENFIGAVYYNSTETAWQSELNNFIADLESEHDFNPNR